MPGLTPQSSLGALGRMRRPSCYCKWAGGFLFPWRARLASASPDKGTSSWPAVSPRDHRVLGGAWGARLWLWGQQTGGRVEIPRHRRAGMAECTGDRGGAGAAGGRGRSESGGWGSVTGQAQKPRTWVGAREHPLCPRPPASPGPRAVWKAEPSSEQPGPGARLRPGFWANEALRQDSLVVPGQHASGVGSSEPGDPEVGQRGRAWPGILGRGL